MTEQVGGIEYVVDADLRPFIRGTEEVDKRLEAMGKSMDDSGQSMKSIEANARLAGKAAADLSSDMAEARKRFDEATSAITDNTGGMASSAAASAEAGRAAATLASDIAAANKRFSEATAGLEANSVGMKSIESGAAATSLAMGTLAAAVDAANKKFSDSSGSALSIATGLGDASTSASQASAAISALATEVQAASKQFEASESSIGLSDSGMKQASKAAAELATDISEAGKRFTESSAAISSVSGTLMSVGEASEVAGRANQTLANDLAEANRKFLDATAGIESASTGLKTAEAGATSTSSALSSMTAAIDSANKRFSDATSYSQSAASGLSDAGSAASSSSSSISAMAKEIQTASKQFADAEGAINLGANSMKLADAAAAGLRQAADAATASLSSIGDKSATAGDAMKSAAEAAETEAQAIERIAKTVSTAYPILNQYNEANDALVQSGRRATAAQEEQAMAQAKAAKATKESTDTMSDSERQQARMANSLRNVKRATEEEAAALTKLMARIDPTSAKVRGLYVDMDLLSAAFSKGLLSPQQYADSLKKLEAQIDKLEGTTKKGSVAMDVFKFALAPIAAALAAVKVAAMAKDMAAMAEQMAVARVQVMRLTDATDGGVANFEALMRVSQRMGSTMADTQKVWAKFAHTLGELGKSDAEIIKLTETVQQLGALGGTSGAQVATAVDSITRAVINGTGSSRDLISILKQAPEVGRAISEQLGIPLSELQKGLKNGTINGEDMINALVDGSARVNAEFSKLPRTVGEAGTAMETAFGNAFLKINDALGASVKLAAIMDKISKGIDITTGNVSGEVKINQLMVDRANLMERISKTSEKGLGGLYRVEMEKELAKVNKEILDIQNERVAAQKRENDEKKKYDAVQNDPNRTSGTGDKEAQKAKERIALLKLEGVAKAKEAALQKLDSKATEADKKRAMELAVEEYNLTEELAAKKKKTREDAAASKKAETKAQAEAAKEAKDAIKHTEENTKAITDMAVALSIAGLKGKELAQAQALMKLNKWATPEDIAKMKELATAMDEVNQKKINKESLGKIDPMVGEAERFRVEMEEIEKLRQADLLSHQRYVELKGAAEYQNSLAMQKLAEADFARQSFTNQFLMDGINAMASATTQTMAGLLSGTMDAKSAMQGFASVILNQAVGAIVELGFAQVKNALITKTVQAAASATYATSVAAQAQATSFLAAQAAFASTAAIPVTGPAMAPAAATAAFATAQGLGQSATTFAAAAGRFNGGPVQQDGMYKVNEGGAPEIFNAANGSQYMMPNQRGEVVSNKNATGGGGQNIEMNFYMSDDGGSADSTGNQRSQQLMETLGMMCVDVINRESQQGGILWENFGNGG